MRIISGLNRGKQIIAPAKLPVRPTTDFAKEALFNILSNNYYFESIAVLDLFAGTGNISYELASRGCKSITAVDKHPACIKFINQTAEALSYPINTLHADVYEYLKRTTQQFDFIFADPPYEFSTEQFIEIANLVFSRNLLTDNGLLVIEHSKRTNLETAPHYTDTRYYGGNAFSFFEQIEDSE